MSLILETVQTEGIAALSYLIGDDKTGTAAVIDPRPDVEIYVELARQRKVAITHVFETHIHADLVSGARELATRVKTAKLFLSVEGEAKYGFDDEVLRARDGGEQFEGETETAGQRQVDGSVAEISAATYSSKNSPHHQEAFPSLSSATHRRPPRGPENPRRRLIPRQQKNFRALPRSPIAL